MVSGLGKMTDSLNVVAVRPDDECRIVIGVVMRANPRRTIVLTSGSQSLFIELVDLASTVCNEGKVEGQRVALCRAQPKRGLLRPPKPRGVRKFHHDTNAQRRKRAQEERLACFQVTHSDTDMIKYDSPL